MLLDRRKARLTFIDPRHFLCVGINYVSPSRYVLSDRLERRVVYGFRRATDKESRESRSQELINA